MSTEAMRHQWDTVVYMEFIQWHKHCNAHSHQRFFTLKHLSKSLRHSIGSWKLQPLVSATTSLLMSHRKMASWMVVPQGSLGLLGCANVVLAQWDFYTFTISADHLWPNISLANPPKSPIHGTISCQLVLEELAASILQLQSRHTPPKPSEWCLKKTFFLTNRN